MPRSARWEVPAALAGPVILEVNAGRMSLELGKRASRATDGGLYVGGAYVHFTADETRQLIRDLQDALRLMEEDV